MEDRYLFKAKRLDTHDWILGFLSMHKTGKYFIRPIGGSASSSEEVEKNTICQCTGLKDKNGKLIWESDIMVANLDDAYLEDETYIRILWYESGFCSKEKGSEDMSQIDKFDQEHFEVYGNIFDNKELLESEGQYDRE